MIKLLRFSSCIVILLLVALQTNGQVPTQQWINSYGGDRNDIAYSAHSTDNGDVLIAGMSYSDDGDLNDNKGKADAWLLRINAQGQTIWSKNYGGSEHDAFYDIKSTADGGFVLVGTSFSADGELDENRGKADYWILKVNENGMVQWSKTYGGNDQDQASGIILMADGGYLVYGHSVSSDLENCGKGPKADAWVIRLDAGGDLLWSQTYGGEGNDLLKAAWLNSDASVLLVGYTDSQTSSLGEHQGATDAWAIKIATDGALLWSKQYGGTRADFVTSISQSDNNTYLLGGYTYSDDGDLSELQGLRDAWTFGINAQGTLLWSKSFGGSHHEEINALLLNDGNYLVGGYTWSADGPAETHFGNKDFYLRQMDATGSVLWQQNYGGSQSDILYYIVEGTEESIYLIGSSRSEDGALAGTNNKGLEDVLVIKLKENESTLSVDLGPDLLSCPNDELTLNATQLNCSCIYEWNDGATTAIRTISPDANITYSVTITDNNGTTASDAVTINIQPFATIDQMNLEHPSCFNANDGSIVLALSNNTYEFIWNNGSTTQNISNVAAGNYMVTISGSDICPTVETFTLTEPLELTASVGIVPTGCGAAVGAIDLEPEGGTPPYQYLWNNGSTTQDLNNLAQGNYQVSISDQQDCKLVVQLSIPSTGDFNAEVSVEQVSCYGEADGAIDLEVGTATNPIYVWNNGALTQDLDGLSAGIYTVTIVMGNGCLGVQSIEVTEPHPLDIQGTIVGPDCNGFPDGSIGLTLTGGTGDYEYQWSTGAGGTTVNVGSGTYGVSVEDANGCQAEDTFFVDEPALIEVDAMVDHVSCGGAGDGAIDLMVTGGVGDYEFSWSNGQSVEDIENLTGGIYTVQITDANDCSLFRSFQIIGVPEIEVEATLESPSMGGNDGSILIATSGGIPPYQINWSNGSNSVFNDNLSVGTYTVTVVDAADCQFVESFDLEEITASNELALVNTFHYYPNPSNGLITVELEWKKQVAFSMEIYNVIGQKIQETKYETQSLSTQLDLQDVASGIYFVRVFSDGKGMSRRLVILNE